MNRKEINTAANARAHEETPPPPADDLDDRLGKHGISPNQLRKVRAAFQAKNHALTPTDLDQIDAFMRLPKKSVGILLSSWLYAGNIPPVPHMNGHTNGLAPPPLIDRDAIAENERLARAELEAEGIAWE